MELKTSSSRFGMVPYVGEEAVRHCVAAAQRVGKVKSLRPRLQQLDVLVRGSLWCFRNEGHLSIAIVATEHASSRICIKSISYDGVLNINSAKRAIDHYLDALEASDPSEVPDLSRVAVSVRWHKPVAIAATLIGFLAIGPLLNHRAPTDGNKSSLTADSESTAVIGKTKVQEIKDNDVEQIMGLGELAKLSGFATQYDFSSWHNQLDLSISSLLPGDARGVASAVCETGRKRSWRRSWEVRVFLAVGDRPAATCTIHSTPQASATAAGEPSRPAVQPPSVFRSFETEANRLTKALKCSQPKITPPIAGVPNQGRLYGCIQGKAETVKIFMNEDGHTKRVKDIKVMWNDWTKDTGYGIHADHERAHAALKAVLDLYNLPRSEKEKVIATFTSNEQIAVLKEPLMFEFTYHRGPAIDERLITISERR